MRKYYDNIGTFGLRDVLELTASRVQENKLTESVQKQMNMNCNKDFIKEDKINNEPCSFAGAEEQEGSPGRAAEGDRKDGEKKKNPNHLQITHDS